MTLHDLTRMREVETTRKEFVTNVSHELRNPLSSIKAMVETLEDGALEDQQVARNFLGRIHRDVDRMVSLVNDLLELSRLESGGATLQLAPLDLRPLIEEVIAQLQAPSRDREDRALPSPSRSLGPSSYRLTFIVKALQNGEPWLVHHSFTIP